MGTAKAFGMKVTRYFVGFGPTLWSFKRGETEYGLKAIPLGGFVKIVGMTPQDDDVEPGDEKRAMWRYPVWKRTIVMAAGSATHFALGIVILWVVFAFIALPNPDRLEVRDRHASTRWRPASRPRSSTTRRPVGQGVRGREGPGQRRVRPSDCSRRPGGRARRTAGQWLDGADRQGARLRWPGDLGHGPSRRGKPSPATGTLPTVQRVKQESGPAATDRGEPHPGRPRERRRARDHAAGARPTCVARSRRSARPPTRRA